jgi:hypothetical protein
MPAADQTSRVSVAMVPVHRGALARSAILSWTLRVATAAALGIDAAVHWANASAYDAVGATVTQWQLFRSAYAEGAAVVLAGLGLRTHRKHPGMERLIPVGSDR